MKKLSFQSDKEFAQRLQKPTIKDPRLIIGVLLIIFSMTAVGLVLKAGNKTETYLVAKNDISVGQKLSADDVVPVEAKMEDTQKSVYFTNLEDISGQYATAYIKAGKFLGTTDLENPSSDSRRKVTVVLESNAAAALNNGDRVDIWVARPKENSQEFESPQTIMVGAEVSGKTSDESLIGGTGKTAVTVLVLDDALPQLLEAVNNESKINLIPTNYSKLSGDL